MQITRLPLPDIQAAPRKTPRGPQAVEPPLARRAVPHARAAEAGEAGSRVVRGEFLGRVRENPSGKGSSYQSTRAFVEERTHNRARPAGEPAVSAYQTRSALSRYALHLRAESPAERLQGQRVNYFV